MRIAINSESHSYNYLLKMLLFAFSLFILSSCTPADDLPVLNEFDQQRAFQDLVYQVELGPRIPGSEAHQRVRQWLLEVNSEVGWEVSDEFVKYQGQEIHNIVAKREAGKEFPLVIIGAHYDTRVVSDKDPIIAKREIPVPGANDGASGVAVLNELARVLPKEINANIWLVYFDAEDNGSLPGGEWIMGSRAFVEQLNEVPDAVVIVDMVGDRDLDIYYEKNSDEVLSNSIWAVAESLGYVDVFISEAKYRIIDDHLPFIQAGIPAVDIIDFDYPYWHTTSDTVDKVSAESLGIVGEVVLRWLLDNYGGKP